MNKRNILFAGVLTLSLMASGCASQASSASASGSTADSSTSQSAQAPGAPGSSDSKTGTHKFTPPSMYGKVASIVGNEVTLQLAEMPKRQARVKPSGTGSSSSGTKSLTTSSGGGGFGGPPGMGTTKSTLKLTGETKSFEIPVGIPITQGMGKQAKSLQISDIVAGSTITVWMEGETVTKISVAASTSSSGN